MYESEDDFERELREGLRPRQAPAGFSERVIDQIAARVDRVPVGAIRSRGPDFAVLRWAIAAALLVAVGVGGYSERRRQERAAGERAREQVFLALRITGSTLHAVHDRVVDR